jgi:hypothetical protein
LLAGSGIAIAALAPPDHDDGARTFRFEQIYVKAPADTKKNQTSAAVEAWYSNTGTHRLRDVKIVVLLIENGRGVVVQRVDRQLGSLGPRHTFDSSFDVTLNATQSYQIDVLVLVDGLLVARGQGGVSFTRILDMDGSGRASFQLAASDGFHYEYQR